MKAVFFYRADNATFTIDYPRIPRGLIKNGQRPYKVRFIGEDTNNRNILNWMKRCKLCVPPHSQKRSVEHALVDDMSDSPVSQETQESIVALMTQKIDPAPQTDKHIFLDALNGSRGETQKAIAEVGLQWIATLLKKNNDYGSSVFKEPVLAPGMPVVSAIDVRMSDKIARIQNLKTSKSEIVSESIQDTYNDLGSYCLLRAVAEQINKGITSNPDPKTPITQPAQGE